MTPLEEILEALNGVTKSGDGYAAFCPAHDDTKSKSLTVSEGEDGRVLAHCLAGNTRVITRRGTRAIRDLAEGEHEVLTTGAGGSKWVKAPFRSFGIQPVRKIALSRCGAKKAIWATPEHRWITQRRTDSPLYIQRTDDLKPGVRLKSLFRERRCDTVSAFGVAHGFTYGDGHLRADGYGCIAQFCGAKDDALLAYFPKSKVYDRPGAKQVHGLPKFFKTLPPLDEAIPYLLGWLAGYFAADGSIEGESGAAVLSSAKKASLYAVRDIANVVGIGTYGVRTRLRRGIGQKEDTPLYMLTLRTKDLFPEFFLIPTHRERFEKYCRTASFGSWVVESVGDLESPEEVFCATVPDTHTFALEDNILTGNCHKGCTFREVFQALGLEPKDAFPKPIRSGRDREYKVRDHTGRVVAVHHRQDNEGKKKVWWTTPDGKGGLGGLKTDSLPLWGAEAVSSVAVGEPVIVCEGEKAAFALTYRGIPAVGTVTGAAGTPSEESLRILKGYRVVLWPDADEEGLKHMRRVGKLLSSMGCEVSWFEWEEAPEKGDAADHPDVRRGNVEALQDRLRAAKPFVAPHDPASDGAATFSYATQDYAELLRLRRQHGGISGIRTGIPKVDTGTHGLNKGYSYIIAARPNVGKSLLAGQIALTAAEQGYRTLLQTPEMSAVQYLDRFACRMADVDYFRVQDGRITDEEERHLNSAAGLIAKLPLLVDEYGGQMVERIRQNIERHEPDLLIVDYLQYLQADDKRANRNQQVGQISRDLARLKSDYNIPVVLAAQLNRAAEHRQTGEPVLADLRDSGELEQDADVVIMLHRPDMYDPDVNAEDEEVRILCRKNRMGTLWHTTLRFVPGQQWLTDEPRQIVAGRVS